ncbi:MAG TPA: glycerophosphodiester phosphodiesterase [Acidimicrobiales bacterium]|nr:glycerophosphodiester phosphodiesterase [Acidimicrobiales bacterium]
MRVIAHRTCPQHAPENSLRGIQVAAELGADAVEVDVRLARDGTPVLNHDVTGWRTSRWPLPIRWTSSARIRRIGRMPTFAAALDALGPDLGINVDVKADSALGPAMATLQQAGLAPDRVALWVRSEDAVRQAVRVVPDMTVGLLADASSPAAVARYIERAALAGAAEVSLHESVTTADAVAAGHGRGLRVHSWLVRRDSLDRVLAAGPDGIVTDWPEDVRR